MLFTTTFVSALAFFATMTGFVHATGPRAQCIEKYRVPQDNATCVAVEQLTEVNTTALQSMNPGVNCSNGTLTPGDMVCTKQYTPVCTKNATATSTTSDPLTNAWNLTTAAFVLLNDDVDDGGDDLVVGNPYCVSIDGCYPGNTDSLCQQ